MTNDTRPQRSDTAAETERTHIAIAVVRDAGRVLIGRRDGSGPLPGFWEFPGGKIEPGESPAAAARRECAEETQLTVSVEGVLQVVDHEYDHGCLRLHFLGCRPVGDAPAITAPHRWVATCDLGAYEFPPANADVVKRLINGS
jgi:8-oxo-dGTP diphosphatase